MPGTVPHRTSPSRRRCAPSFPLTLALVLALASVAKVAGQCDYNSAVMAGAGGFIQTDAVTADNALQFANDGHTSWTQSVLTFNPPTAATISTGATTAYGAIASWVGKRHVESGFEVRFTMQYTNPNTDTGFAFVISRDLALSSGSSSGNTLGYASIPNAFAIEFDCKADSALGETAPNHVTVQSSIGLTAISPASTATVSPVFSTVPTTMCGSTSTTVDVSVIYSPLGATGGTVKVTVGGVSSSLTLTKDIRSVLYDSVNKVYLPANFGFTTSVNQGSKYQLILTNIKFLTLGANPNTATIASGDGTFGKAGYSLPVIDAQTVYAAGSPPAWMPRAYAVDFCGNKLGVAGSFTFTAQLQQGATVYSSATQQAKVETLNPATDGSYPIQVWSSVTGTFQLAVTLQGAPVSGSPFTIQFVAGAIAPDKSVALVGVDPATLTFAMAQTVAQTSNQLTFQAQSQTQASTTASNTKNVYIWAVDKFLNPVNYGTAAGQTQAQFIGGFLPDGQSQLARTFSSTPVSGNLYVLKVWHDVVGNGNIPLYVQLVTGGTPVNLRGNTDQIGNQQVPRYQPCKITPGPPSVSSARLDGGFLNAGTNNLVQVVAGAQSIVRLQLYDGVVIPGTNSFGNAIAPSPGSANPPAAAAGLSFNLSAVALGPDTYGLPIPVVPATSVWDPPSGYFQLKYTTTKAAQYKIFVQGSDSTQNIQYRDISNTNYFTPITLVGATSGPNSFIGATAVSTTPVMGALGTAVSGDQYVTYINAADAQGNIGQAISPTGTYIQCGIFVPTLGQNAPVVTVYCGTPALATNYNNNNPQSIVAANSASCVALPSPLGRYKLTFIPLVTADYSLACALNSAPASSPSSSSYLAGSTSTSPFILQVAATGPSAATSVVWLPPSSGYYEVCTAAECASGSALTALTAVGKTNNRPIQVTLTVRDKFGNLRSAQQYNDTAVLSVSLVAIDGSVVSMSSDPVQLLSNGSYQYTLYSQTAGQFKVWVEIPRGTAVPVSQDLTRVIAVFPGPMVPAPQPDAVNPPAIASSVDGGGLFRANLPITLNAVDRFKNPVLPTGSGNEKYGPNYTPVAPQINGGTNPVIMTSSASSWTANTPPGNSYTITQPQQTNIQLFSYTITTTTAGPVTAVGTDACDAGKTRVAGQPISFKLTNVDPVNNAQPTNARFNIFTQTISSQIFLNVNNPAASYDATAHTYGPGTWTPPVPGEYTIRIFDGGQETSASVSSTNPTDYKIKCIVKTGGISGLKSGLSVVPTSVIAGVSFTVTVTFRDIAGTPVYLNDVNGLLPPSAYTMPTALDKFQVLVKGTQTTETATIINITPQNVTNTPSLAITVVARRIAPSAVVQVLYTQPDSLGLTPAQVTITGSQQIVVLANAPWYGSVPLTSLSAVSPATAGVSVPLNQVTFQDLYNNTIDKNSWCSTCRVYLSFVRASNPSTRQLVPATSVSFDQNKQATVTFIPTVSDYTQLSSFGWYVSDVPGTYNVSVPSDLVGFPSQDGTGLPVCDQGSGGGAAPVCVTADVTPVASGTLRHAMSWPSNQAMFIFPGTPTTTTSVTMFFNATQPNQGQPTTGQVIAGQSQQFQFKLADGYGNGWRGTTIGTGNTVSGLDTTVVVQLVPPVASGAAIVQVPLSTAPPPTPGFQHDDKRINMGWYTGALQLTTAGVWTLQLSAGGVVVFSQSVSVTTAITVAPYLPYPQHTIFGIPSPARIRAGTSSNTTITLRDQYFNVISLPPSSPIQLTIQFYAQEQTQPPHSPTWQACTNSRGLAPDLTPPGSVAMLAGPTYTILPNGKVGVSFTPRATGLFYAWVQVGPVEQLDPSVAATNPASGNANVIPDLNDNIVACNRNPFSFSVIPGDISPAACTIEGPGVQSARVLVPTQFQVVLRDKFGNQIATAFALSAAPTSPVFPVVRDTSATLSACASMNPPSANVLNSTLLSSAPTDNGDGSANYMYTPQKAGQRIFMSVSLDTNFINSKNQELQKLNGGDAPQRVDPDDGTTLSKLGTPPCIFFTVHSSFTATISSSRVNAVATIPTQVSATGFDVFANPVDFGAIGYVQTMTRRADTLQVASFTTTAKSTPNDTLLQTQQIQNIPFTPSWEGTYDVVLVQNPTDPTDPKVAQGTRIISPYVWVINVTAAKCSATPPYTLPFRCPNGQCAASQAACASAPPICSGTATYCSGNTCGNCNQPVLSGGGPGYTQLYTEFGAAVTTCSTGGGVRSGAANCPTLAQCPWGWTMCPDGYTCAQTSVSTPVSQCPPPSSCPSDRPVACPNGRCASRAENCGSQVTCPSGQVLCPDGSCASSRDVCQEILRCDAYPNPVTNANASASASSSSALMVRCAAGTCRAGWADCPVPRACPAGWTLCENGQCVPFDTPCAAANKCNITEHRCADGTCRQNHLLCPSQTTCPANKVLCADGECADDLALCRTPQPCPAANPVFCPDGSCATSFGACATTKTCPLNRPTLCPDGSCAVTVKDCVSVAPCPSFFDVRCPDGSCRASVTDCPTGVHCPAQAPVRCSDGRCAQAPEVCTDPAQLVCAVGQVRCPAGECANSLEQCPTPVTCPLGLQRCVDGTCRVTCNMNLITTSLTMCPSNGLITCPNSHSGVACAASLAECPVSMSCPWNRPVRCMDQSCVVSAADCPTAPSALSSSQFGCMAGGINTVSIASCGTSVTCPASAPVKCWDDTCRIVADDCPAPPRCPQDSVVTPTATNSPSPYMCFDGSCSNTFTCPAPTTCPAELPVKCSWWRPLIAFSLTSTEFKSGGAAGCAATINDCINMFGSNTLTQSQAATQGGGITVLPQLSPRRGLQSTPATQAGRTMGDCPTALQQRVRSGACVTSTANTAQAPCPLHTQFRCQGGLCVRGTALTPLASTLTSTAGTGADNPSDVCPSAAQLSEGCDAGQVRCHDGSCAAPDACVDDTSDLYNACPASRPYRCTNGYCAASVTRCPLIPESVGATDACPADTPIRCADGSCRLFASQCPVIRPCYSKVDPAGNLIQVNSTRCIDGTCAVPGQSCPSTAGMSALQLSRRCPKSRPVRCPSGLCAVTVALCTDDPDPSKAWNGGCPVDPVTSVSTRCSKTGFCSTAPGDCPAGPLAPANGCKVAGQVKCWDGSCAATLAACAMAPSGCPQATPVLCANGQCVGTSASCPTVSSTPTSPTPCSSGVRCPSGRCMATYDACPSAQNCPAGQLRCADGDCKPLRAQFSLPNNPFNPATMCVPTVVCDPRTPYMCADGACVSDTSLCRPVHTCALGVYCPYTTSCLASAAACPSPNNLRNNTSGLSPVCPSSQPALCPDGSCRRTPSQCHNSAQQPLCAPSEARCWDGTCESSYAACISRAVLLRVGVPSVDGTPTGPKVTLNPRTGTVAGVAIALMPLLPSNFKVDGTAVCPAPAKVMCPDGECVTDQSLCQPIPSCPTSHPLRCWDGSCLNATSSASCPPAPLDCPGGFARCEDGVCRPGDANVCPVFSGCPANRGGVGPYYCSGLPNSPCVTDGMACAAAQPNGVKDAQVCVDNCERDNPVRVTQVSVAHTLASEARDITVDVSFNANNVIRTQVIIPAGPVPAGNDASQNSPRVVTFQPMPFFTSRLRKAPNNNPTKYDSRDVQLLSSPFSCSIDGSAGGVSLSTYFQVSGAIDRQFFQPQFDPNPLNANTGNTQVPCVYQGKFQALDQSPWTTDDKPVQGSFYLDAQTISFNMQQPFDTINIKGSLLPWNTDPAVYTKWSLLNDGQICLCFNVTSQTPINAPLQGVDITNNFVPQPGYDPVTNFAVGTNFCVAMWRPKASAILTASSWVVQPADKNSMTCPVQQLGPNQRKLTLTHEVGDYDCGTSPAAQTATLTNIPADRICFAQLARSGPNAGRWACTEPDEAFYNITQPNPSTYYPLTQYRAWDSALGLPLTRAQGIVTVCDPNVFYAFMQSNPPLPPLPPVVTCDLWCQYWKVILGVVLGVGIFSCLAAFAIWRLIRYRRKYKEKQEHLRDLKDRAMELDQYHGGLGVESEEDDIHMMANPLVIEMQDLELQIRKVEQDMNIQGDQERLQIDQLEMERQRLYAEIQRVKEAMSKQNTSTGAPARADPTPQPLHGYTQQHTHMVHHTPLPGQTPQARLVPQNTTSESTIHHEFGQVRRPAKKKDF